MLLFIYKMFVNVRFNGAQLDSQVLCNTESVSILVFCVYHFRNPTFEHVGCNKCVKAITQLLWEKGVLFLIPNQKASRVLSLKESFIQLLLVMSILSCCKILHHFSYNWIFYSLVLGIILRKVFVETVLKAV